MSGSGLTILKASYGTTGNFTDVSKEVQSMVQDGTIDFTVSAQNLGILDPAPGVQKTFQMQYTINGGTATLMQKNDGDQVSISAPPDTSSSGPVSAATSLFGYVHLAFGIFLSIFLAAMGFYTGRVIAPGALGIALGVLLAVMSMFSMGVSIFFIVFLYAVFGGVLLFPTQVKNVVTITTSI
jgi:hypothetical protein